MVSGSDELQGFRKLYEFSRLLLEGDDPENLLNRLVEATRAITDADEVVLFLIEGGEPMVRAVARDNPRQSAPTDTAAGSMPEVEYSETLVDAVVSRGAPLLLEDVCDDPRFEESHSVQLLSITSAMGAPLFDEGKLTGVLYVSRKRMAQNFTENHRELMTIAASQASLLLSRVASIQALRESECRYRSLVEMSPSAIAVVQNRRLMFANRTACRLWNRQAVTELVGSDVSELFDPWRSQALLAALRGGEPFETVDAWAWDGSEEGVPVEVVGRPIDREGSRAMQLIISSVSEHDEVLDRRVRTDRMMVMGMMTATVGHEINNPLSYIWTNLDYVIEELSRWWDDECADQSIRQLRRDVMDGLDSARNGTERIRGVVESMQDFTRLDDDDGEPAKVERPLKSSLRIARNELDSDVELEVNIDSCSPVPVSAARLGQVFLNLLINAAQALNEVSGDEQDKKLKIEVRDEDDRVVVEFADTGPGIEPEVQEHIFEPFVSTKCGDAGTGLGLAICSDIVEAGGGRIEVESEPGQGSLFRIHFPPVQKMEPSSRETITDVDEHRPARVLIVDPEPILCQSLERGLGGRHDVTAVSSKGEAIAELQHGEAFDLILCDLRLRGGLGRDFFEWVQKQAPHYWDKLVAMTTHRPSPNDGQYLEELPNGWISKPFELKKLRAVIGDFAPTDVAENTSD